jgi:hypothetical protein
MWARAGALALVPEGFGRACRVHAVGREPLKPGEAVLEQLESYGTAIS